MAWRLAGTAFGASLTTILAAVAGAGASSLIHAFPYTAAGGETAPFDINLPVARGDASYEAFIQLGTAAADLTFRTDNYRTDKFACSPSAPLTAGDVLWVFIVERTS